MEAITRKTIASGTRPLLCNERHTLYSRVQGRLGRGNSDIRLTTIAVTSNHIERTKQPMQEMQPMPTYRKYSSVQYSHGKYNYCRVINKKARITTQSIQKGSYHVQLHRKAIKTEEKQRSSMEPEETQTQRSPKPTDAICKL